MCFDFCDPDQKSLHWKLHLKFVFKLLMYVQLQSICQVRTAERSVEGRHSLVSRILRRAPRASTGYISLELRFPHLQYVASTRPQLLKGVSNAISGMETHAGLVTLVMFLVVLICLGFSGELERHSHSSHITS